jgi:hypothetical protein
MMQPSGRGQHCPFLNRTDERCGQHFTLEQMEHAFVHCFDLYTHCPVYQELLIERRVRRGEAIRLTVAGEPVEPERATGEAQTAPQAEKTALEPGQVGLAQAGANHGGRKLIEITINAARFAKIPRIGAPITQRAA